MDHPWTGAETPALHPLIPGLDPGPGNPVMLRKKTIEMAQFDFILMLFWPIFSVIPCPHGPKPLSRVDPASRAVSVRFSPLTVPSKNGITEAREETMPKHSQPLTSFESHQKGNSYCERCPPSELRSCKGRFSY
jgi:hypothetical protein